MSRKARSATQGPLDYINAKKTFFSSISSQMTQEISIHREIAYKHVVKFQSFFEDSDNVYILLELCRRRVLYHERN